jgi:hypothetical protein
VGANLQRHSPMSSSRDGGIDGTTSTDAQARDQSQCGMASGKYL